jgi:hypothetical protein
MITNHKYEGLRGVFFVQTGRDTHSRMAMARWRFQKMILTHVFLKGGANLHYRFDAEPYQTLCLRTAEFVFAVGKGGKNNGKKILLF